MELSTELISQFAKITNDNKTDKKTETTVFGTVKLYDGEYYVQLDGSDLLTPIETTTDVAEGERVTVMIKNHSATVTGNVSSPSAKSEDVKEVGGKVEAIGKQITEFETVVADKVTTTDLQAVNAIIDSLRTKTANITNADIVNAEIDNLQAKYAELEYIDAKTIEALNADIENLRADFAEIGDISTEDLEAINADIDNLKAYNAEFTYVSADVLSAIRADIKKLDVDKLSAEKADMKYANIDFANINQAAVQKIFSDSGIIKDLIVSEGKITGELVGVTIKGDLIEGATIKADKLVVKGSDGLYYKLNLESGTFAEGEVVPTDGIHGSVIVAESITAEKIAVDDLVAFGATIGGFNIKTNSLYSGVKESVDNTTIGVYIDDTGQFALGDGSNYLKFYQDEEGHYILDISASSIKFTASDTTVEGVLEDLQKTTNDIVEWSQSPEGYDMTFKSLVEYTTKFNDEYIKDYDERIKYIKFVDGEIRLGKEIREGEDDFTLAIANDRISFKQNNVEVAYISNDKLYITEAEVEVLTVTKTSRIGHFETIVRSNGNVGEYWVDD